TSEEHEAFLRGIHLFQRNWEVVASLVPTPTVLQIRTYGQKYFKNIGKEQPFPDKL
ncbi:unnamed protein product, partial [Sphacelaria rigidula]